MSNYRPYPKYKPSGVEWLGDVPEEWSVGKIGHLFRESNRTGEPTFPILSVSIHDGISDGEIPDEDKDRKVSRSEDRSIYKVVRQDDLVYNMMRAWQGGFGAAQVDGIVSPAYVVARPKRPILTKFIELVLRTPGAIEEMRRYSRGITDFRLRLYWDEFRCIDMPSPPRLEQEKILSFLDRECGKLDALQAKQERLVELLKEKRQALISHAVTKGLPGVASAKTGLDPTAKLKPSGIEWLGEVPEHWWATTIKRFSTLQRGHDLTDSERTDGPYPVVTSGGVNGTHGSYIAKGPGVATGRYGSTGRLFYIEEDFWPHNTSLYVNDFHGNAPRFVWYSLQTVDFAAHSAKSAVPGIDRNDIHPLPVIVPPLAEQRAIVAHLDEKCGKIDQLKAKAERGIELLKERRSALISAAVTGKIDVRESLKQTAPA